ncbi:aerolysin-like protein [Salvelinus namaycush]|uniref:Aerolysin-like protein n=1 Tax=Salvelinus namaycush TaxID=8040 RepID=A0A8U1F001_SALNM|nr:aerolysin-like protein [Salvelinus namaycush]XP_038867205.1 aerolysin-like protein [Salvelinus namaycush]XP_038867206.1 aerolysin-like protein [Salvelinus namaycush]XP_038867207.1 aerolysin-like protein [Salvelinus namaycush]
MATTLELIGGQGGSAFEFHGMNNGATLKKIGVAVEGWQVKAVRVELTDGRVATFGEANTFKEFEFKLGERITKLSLWGNGAGTRLGAIKFTTNENREFFEKMTSWGLKTEYTINVGSGICLGLQGRSGSDIDCMGFLFINNIKSSVLTDMRYPTLSLFKPQVSPEYVKSLSHHNDTSLVQEESISYSKTLTKTSSWSVSNKIESTLSVSVKAGIPDLVEVSSGFSLTVGVEHSTSLEKTETITESDTINLKIPPGKTMDVEVTVGRANIDLDYEANVKVTCMNGSQLVFPSKGVYTGVTYTSARVSTKER